MSKGKKILLIVGILVLASVVGLYFAGFFKPKRAGLIIESEPAASVYLDGEQVGRTPYTAIHDPGEVVVSLIPDSFDTPLAPFEKKIVLTSGIETVVSQNFAESDELSSGAILSFEKTASSDLNVTVLSEPDSSQVKIDGSIRGFTPHQVSSISEGEHTLTVSAPGFVEKSIPIQAVKGYTLTAIIKLAPSDEIPEEIPEETSESDETEQEITYVEILSTPTDFLRVRSEPDTTGDELTRVSPGERYLVLSTDEEDDWYEIEYEEDESGWVSGEYVTLVEDGENEPTVTPAES